MSDGEYKGVTVDYLRMHYIDELRISMSQLKECADNCLKKIEAEGISGYYSINSDVGRYSEKAWRASWALGELKRMEDKIAEQVDAKVEIKLQQLFEDINSKIKKKTEK
jgi:uncharacterized protein (DUF427 family)